jgi:hypothetical protein
MFQFHLSGYRVNSNEISFVIPRSNLLDIIASHSHTTPPMLISSSSSNHNHPPGPKTLEWSSWGPRNSQVFQRRRAGKVGTCGKRLVFHDECKAQVVVCDFNPYAVRRVEKERLSADHSLASANLGSVVRNRHLDRRVSPYKDEVETSLPYVETAIEAKQSRSMQNILIDDGIVLYERHNEVRLHLFIYFADFKD